MMKIARSSLAFALFLAIYQNVFSQITSYKRNVLEIKIGVGGTTFFGDLGGSQGKGKDAFFDLDLATLGANNSYGLKCNINNRFAIRTDFGLARVSASDQYSEDENRRKRNLSFRSNIHEVSVTGEMVLVNMSQFTRNKRATIEVYSFLGLGAIQFNPQAELNGVWYDLQPLSTEGQGLEPGKSTYKLTSWVVPFGVGFRKDIGKRNYIGFELSMRKTFTDYIDDVSTTYADKTVLQSAKGDIAVQLSDRNLGEPYEGRVQRGNPNNNDNYSFLQFTYSRSIGRKNASSGSLWQSLSPHKVRCPKF
ncbi:MAG: hypothetical protein H6607_07315 [Flavobacteriales bacterium]|nr:hypothetical protein [Flavobacteriales bacterium]